jgi:hypothetical protein
LAVFLFACYEIRTSTLNADARDTQTARELPIAIPALPLTGGVYSLF